MSENKTYYLIVKRGLYYRPEAKGYTGVKKEAGLYTLDAAMAYSHPNGENGPRDGISYLAEADAPEFSTACCHGIREQVLREERDESRRLLAEANAAIRQLTGKASLAEKRNGDD